VVTEVSDAVPFWVAEAEHQDYLQRYPYVSASSAECKAVRASCDSGNAAPTRRNF
jgi:peptide methionine sulfoxide reductase MsrA